MHKVGLVMTMVGAVSLAAGIQGASAAKPKAGKAKAAAKGGGGGTPPAASAEEIAKFKGDFKWGMNVDEVVEKVKERIQAAYKDRLDKSAQDPTRHDRIRKELRAELDKVKAKYAKFDGDKTGWDVSIIDQEFGHKTNESMLMVKEETADRYFFFHNERLYKMFLAFDKEILRGKSFQDFGGLMQAKLGRAKEVMLEEKTRAGVKVRLDHLVWGSKAGDALRLVDRSEFYDVYCLVIYDAKTAAELDSARQIANPKTEKRDALVEAVTAGGGNDRDPNDNIVDQITGTKAVRPGEQQGGDIVVPSPTGARGPTPAEVNKKQPGESEGAKGKGKDKPALPSGRPETRGLAL
jgi:hypothetical protein